MGQPIRINDSSLLDDNGTSIKTDICYYCIEPANTATTLGYGPLPLIPAHMQQSKVTSAYSVTVKY